MKAQRAAALWVEAAAAAVSEAEGSAASASHAQSHSFELLRGRSSTHTQCLALHAPRHTHKSLLTLGLARHRLVLAKRRRNHAPQARRALAAPGVAQSAASVPLCGRDRRGAVRRPGAAAGARRLLEAVVGEHGLRWCGCRGLLCPRTCKREVADGLFARIAMPGLGVLNLEMIESSIACQVATTLSIRMRVWQQRSSRVCRRGCGACRGGAAAPRWRRDERRPTAASPPHTQSTQEWRAYVHGRQVAWSRIQMRRRRR